MSDVLAVDPRRHDLVLRILLGAVVLFSLLAWLGRPLTGWVRGTALPIGYEGAVTVPALQGTGIEVTAGGYTLLLPHPSVAQRLVEMLPGLVALAVVVTAVVLVERVVRDVAAGEPFTQRNVTRLTRLALLLVGGWLVAAVLRGAGDFVVLMLDDDLGDLDPQGVVPFDLWPLVVGLLVGVLARAFAAGTRLREDVEGLV